MCTELIYVSIAGLLSGAIMGGSIATDLEHRVRGTSEPWLKLIPIQNQAGIIINVIFGTLVIGLAIILSAVGVMRLGDVYPLSYEERILLVCCMGVGATVSNYAR